ncbi:MAG: hypothetical protein D6726_00830 [Nitrospirae bacterium]|nr:MAG: hypothetical protein D6726_00830 [Nitrospirota bacterium]
MVDGILGVKHGGKTVVSWSLNTPFIIEREERGTAPLEARLRAIRKVAEAGYLLGFHFDPMIYYPGWREDYTCLVREVFKGIPPDRVAWISVGSLRFNPEMKRLIESNYPDTGITAEEMIAGDDGKMRYVKPLRLEMYRHMYKQIREAVGGDPLVYLCMERWDMWQRVLGFVPDSIGHLDYMFARSLWERFGLGSGKPDRTLYERAWEDEDVEGGPARSRG